VAFITLAFAQLFHVFNMASAHAKLFINEITKNKFVWLAILICTALMIAVYLLPQARDAMGLVELPLEVWMISIAASLLPLVSVQAYKITMKLKRSKAK
jgi:Ca2+-transporting ATPase